MSINSASIQSPSTKFSYSKKFTCFLTTVLMNKSFYIRLRWEKILSIILLYTSENSFSKKGRNFRTLELIVNWHEVENGLHIFEQEWEGSFLDFRKKRFPWITKAIPFWGKWVTPGKPQIGSHAKSTFQTKRINFSHTCDKTFFRKTKNNFLRKNLYMKYINLSY